MNHSKNKLIVVIFDVDGTLVDSNAGHVQAWVEAFAEQGRDIPAEKLWPLVGMGGDTLIPEITGLPKDSPEAEELGKRHGEIFKKKYLPSVTPFPHVPELFQRIRDNGLKIVIATSSKQDEMEAMLEIAGVKALVEATSSASEAKNSKPDPDPLAVALKKADCSAEQAVMVGDTPYDIQSAGKVGVGTISLRCGGFRDTDLQGALAIFDDPADLLAHYDESPLRR